MPPNKSLLTPGFGVQLPSAGGDSTGSVTGCAARPEARAQPAPSPRAAVLPCALPSPESLSRWRKKGENKPMDIFGILGFIFGMMGFIFSMTVMGQVSELKKEVEKLKSQLGPKS
jgi:hypothetical protein